MLRGMCSVLLVVTIDVTAAAAAPPSLATCRRQIAELHPSLESYECFRLAAHHDGSFQQTIAALNEIISGNPADYRARFILAGLDADVRNGRSEADLRSAAAQAAAAGDPEAELAARLVLGSIDMARHQAGAAQSELVRAAQLAPRAGPSGVARDGTARAGIADVAGDYGRAIALLKNVEPRLFPDGPIRTRAFWLGLLGHASWALGHYDQAFTAYQRQAALFHAEGDRFEESQAQLNLVLLAQGTQSVDQRRVWTITALQLARQGGNLEAEGHANFYLAQFSQGQEAMDYARRSLTIARKVGDANGLFMALRATASLTAATDPSEGYRLIDEAIADARARADFAEVARNRIVRSRISWRLGPRRQAISDSLAALDAIEAERDLQPDNLVRAWRFSAWVAPYYELSGRLLAGDLRGGGPVSADVALAFTVIERMRARMLLDAMDAARATAAAVPNSPAAAEHARIVDRVSAERRRFLDPGTSPTDRAAAANAIEQLLDSEHRTRSAVAAESPGYAALRAPPLATLDDVRAALDPDEALLSFQIANDYRDQQIFGGGSWLIVQTKQRTDAYRLPSYVSITNRAPVFAGLVQRRDEWSTSAATRMFGDLLAPAIAGLPSTVTRLVIVPDSPVHNFPFEALQSDSSGPLGLRYDIALAPSATTWLRWRNERPPASTVPALVFADPDRDRGVIPASRDGEPLSFSALPRAREEARAIVRDLGGGAVYAGREATETRLKTLDLAPFGLLHFASHAVVDSIDPDRSGVLLNPGSRSEDGWLRPRDIVRLNLHGQVVVLSACQTASGALIEGEGVTGLAHAFFQAGARAVMATRWPLRDDEAAALFETFYRHLGTGARLGEATAGTRRDLIRSGQPRAVWASLVLIGDADLAPFRRPVEPAGWIRPLVWGVLVALLLTTGWHVRRRFFPRLNT